jgi:Ca2+-binding RTX toxin-like protein
MAKYLGQGVGFMLLALGPASSLAATGCSADGQTSATEATATARERIDLEQAPYLKYLFNREGKLYLRQAYVPTNPELDQPLFQTLHVVQDTDANGNVIGEIEGNIPGRCPDPNLPDDCFNAVQNGGASAAVHEGRDWISWATGNEIFVKQLSPVGPTTKISIRQAPEAITSLPAIASHGGFLFAVWAEGFKLFQSFSNDGTSWSEPLLLEDCTTSPCEVSYGAHLSLASFQGTLYVGATVSHTTVRLFALTPFAKGPAYTLANTVLPVVEGSVTLAPLNNEVLGIAYVADSLHQAVYTEDVGSFQGPFGLRLQGTTVRDGFAFGATSPEPTFYALVSNSAGDLVVLTKPASELTSGTEAELSGVSLDPELGRGGGTLYQSPYAFGAVTENTFDFELGTTPCTRKVSITKRWALFEPGEVTGYELLQDGLVVIPFPKDAQQAGVELFVTPNVDHAIQVRALKSDGTSVISPPKPFHFQPCAARTMSVALVRTRFSDSPEPALDREQLADLFAEVRSYYLEQSDGEIVLVGGALEGEPIPAPRSDYCRLVTPDPNRPDLQLVECDGTVTAAAEAANPALAADYDYRIYVVGGRDATRDVALAGGNLVVLNGDLGGFTKTGSTVVHEFGHLLGLEHAGVWACDEAPEDVFDLRRQLSCYSEYGDRFDVMGATAGVNDDPPFPPRDFMAYHGELLGYLAFEQHETVETTGEHSIAALASARSSNELAELRIPLGDPNTFYSIEYRDDDDNDGSYGFFLRLHLSGIPGQLTVYNTRPETLGFASYRSVFNDPHQRVKIERVGIDADGLTLQVTMPADYDTDTDGDGFANADDNCTAVPNPNQLDLNVNGLGDACDPDRDGDGFPNDVDVCPNELDVLQTDTDDDGIGDACDDNADGDSYANELDNCPLVMNEDQGDFDGDGKGDACDDNSLVADAGEDQTIECQGATTAVTLDGRGSGAPDGAVTYAWSASVSLTNADQAVATGNFPLGTHTVNLTVAQDALAASDSAIVTVRDTTPPVLTIPPDVVATSCTAVSLGQATALDACGGTLTPTNDAPATFRAGTYLVKWRVTDAAGFLVEKTQRVSVGLGDSAACCPSGTNVIQGTSNADTLTGTSGADCILGKGGQDTLRGMGGNDIVSGGEGNDTLEGGTGNDFLDAGSGQDTVRGQDGDDVLLGQNGDDFCYGGNHNDRVYGGAGQDRLFGESGNDALSGDSGDDILDGGAGDDTLDGGIHQDQCIGGTGANTVLACES